MIVVSNYKLILGMFVFGFLMASCHSKSQVQNQLLNRKAVAVGKFYPSDKKDLQQELEQVFRNAKYQVTRNLSAIIVPHAGYVFSAQVAANAYNQIDRNSKYQRIFILGPSHYVGFQGASIYNIGNYETPLGEVEVDRKLATELIKKYNIFKFIPEAHEQEHCIEVQLPFLQHVLKNNFKIVPIVIGTQSKNQIKEIAEALKPYFNSDNLFIISSDFSHYPNYKDAVANDKRTCNAILQNDADKFIKQIIANSRMDIPNLVTSACGYSAILSLLYLSETNKEIEYHADFYQNSGDVSYGNKDRVVGYWAITVTKKGNMLSFNLTDKDKRDLLNIAKSTVQSYIREGKIPEIDTVNFSQTIKNNCGAFVTINKNHRLRGCIGLFRSDEPLYKVVQDMAIAASSQDSRFDKIKPEELKDLEIEISVLSPMRKINSIDEIELGKDGIYIKKGYRSGTLLPQVASDNGWSKKQFVEYCAKYKAGIEPSELKNAELFVYEAIVFGEDEGKTKVK